MGCPLMANVRLQPPPRSEATRAPQATLAAVGCKAWLGPNLAPRRKPTPLSPNHNCAPGQHGKQGQCKEERMVTDRVPACVRAVIKEASFTLARHFCDGSTRRLGWRFGRKKRQYR